MGYEVLAVRYATRQTRASHVYFNHHLYAERDEPEAMDYFYWVIRDAAHTIVVDTGFTASVGHARGRSMTCEVPISLSRLGIRTDEVTTVVVTHAHYDHIGNLGLFETSPVVISAAELAFWTGPMARRAQFAHFVEVADLQRLQRIGKDGRLVQISGTHELAPGVTVIEVGGHTPGQLMVLVEVEAGRVLLASDAVHYYGELERDWPFSIVADLAQMYRGYDEIRQLAGDGRTAVVPGHDPRVFDRFPALDPSDPGFGVKIA